VCRLWPGAQVFQVDAVLAAHVVFGGQAGGEHDGVAGTLLRGRGAVAGQVGAGFGL
jgi:hypothetical protein